MSNRHVLDAEITFGTKCDSVVSGFALFHSQLTKAQFDDLYIFVHSCTMTFGVFSTQPHPHDVMSVTCLIEDY